MKNLNQACEKKIRRMRNLVIGWERKERGREQASEEGRERGEKQIKDSLGKHLFLPPKKTHLVFSSSIKQGWVWLSLCRIRVGQSVFLVHSFSAVHQQRNGLDMINAVIHLLKHVTDSLLFLLMLGGGGGNVVAVVAVDGVIVIAVVIVAVFVSLKETTLCETTTKLRVTQN